MSSRHRVVKNKRPLRAAVKDKLHEMLLQYGVRSNSRERTAVVYKAMKSQKHANKMVDPGDPIIRKYAAVVFNALEIIE